MNKLNKVALFVASTLAASTALAAEEKESVETGFQTSAYGQVGFSTQLDADNADAPFLDSRLNEDFKGYQDTKAGVHVDYVVNQYLRINTEIQGAYEGTEDFNVRMKQASLSGVYGAYGAELGRFRTPLYMNSLNDDNDFDRDTYHSVRNFSSEEFGLETLDGGQVSYTRGLDSIGELKLGALVGQAEDRVDARMNEDFEISSKDVWGLNASLASDYGLFRMGYISAEIEKEDADSFSLGYSLDHDIAFVDAELAFEKIADEDITKGYVTVGKHINDFTPAITYSQMEADDFDNLSVEVALSYQVTDNIKVKTAYEFYDQEHRDSDNILSLGAAFKF